MIKGRRSMRFPSTWPSQIFFCYLANGHILSSQAFRCLKHNLPVILRITDLHYRHRFIKMVPPVTLELLIRDHAPNYTIPTELCTLQTCSITQAQLTYDPSLAANVFFAALFGLLLSSQILIGIYYRTWAYAIGMVGGLSLELCGYIGRIQMHYNPFIQSPSFIPLPLCQRSRTMSRYLISLTIGPTWICASMYLCFSRIVRTYNPDLSRLSPRKITVLFICSDFWSLVLQAGGGSIAVIADNVSVEYIGIHLMLAGLGLQVLSLAVVLALGADFARVCYKKPQTWIERYADIRERRYFLGFIYCEEPLQAQPPNVTVVG